MAVIAESWHRRGQLAAGGIVATVMSNLGPRKVHRGPRPHHGAHLGRRPPRRRAHAQARLQRRRRTVRPHRAVGLRHHRRRARLGAAGAGCRGRDGQAGERGLPPLQALSAGAEERALFVAASRSRSKPCARPSRAASRRLGTKGRVVIRPSGTEPVIRVMAEGQDEALVKQVVGEIAAAVETGGGLSAQQRFVNPQQ